MDFKKAITLWNEVAQKLKDGGLMGKDDKLQLVKGDKIDPTLRRKVGNKFVDKI